MIDVRCSYFTAIINPIMTASVEACGRGKCFFETGC